MKVLRIVMAQGKWDFPPYPRDYEGRQEWCSVCSQPDSLEALGPGEVGQVFRIQPLGRERVRINLGSVRQHSTLAPGIGERDILWDVWGS